MNTYRVTIIIIFVLLFSLSYQSNCNALDDLMKMTKYSSKNNKKALGLNICFEYPSGWSKYEGKKASCCSGV